MITDFELLMFTKHLRQLAYDYIKCEDQKIKKQLKDEILFISEIVCETLSKPNLEYIDSPLVYLIGN